MTGRRIRVAVPVPQFLHGAPLDVERLRAFLRREETLGFHSVWVQDQVLGAAASLEPVTLLAYAAAVTRRMHLGVAVLLSALRSPVHLAKSLFTLDQLSGGRLIVGVGLGGRTSVYPAFGIGPETRVRRFTEGLDVMRRLSHELARAGRMVEGCGAQRSEEPMS